ncbi:RNase adapter RapZ [Exiguobacterium sp. SH0S1]|uniref:RNase adapter RapZ n=1 Tax=Exiguobacterium sp. SH0S1 TaxID=2510949 RepID=UPI0003537735|nr:RNase adapter RapZ [Exiguobacterium sp. SH0S1]EPE62688.1 UPF0042 nucleotide-binding protein yvcJ [Exiguobacterium sp. S17]TCI80950.1 RNase adapter RapZ [Exiguobacterium sp. SH0S1]
MEDFKGLEELIIISGMSGAGKSVAMNSFEDLGYFCVDNLPPVLLPQLIDVISSVRPKIAVAIDTRTPDFIDSLFIVIDDLEQKNVHPHLLYLDTRDDVLVRRYKETRRSHPLAPEDAPLVGIKMERSLLEGFRDRAHTLYDTSDLKPQMLKDRILLQFNEERIPFTVNFMSFGFKHGVPLDIDLLFDVRFITNPFYIPELRPLTGQTEAVQTYVMSHPEARAFYKKVIDMLEFLLPQYKREGKAQVVVAFGCTGGKHRSITFAEKVSAHFAERYNVKTVHRDLVHATQEK